MKKILLLLLLTSCGFSPMPTCYFVTDLNTGYTYLTRDITVTSQGVKASDKKYLKQNFQIITGGCY